MDKRSILICGLPESGKTTYLAALWHLISQSSGVQTELRFHSLGRGDSRHLNNLAERWRSARVQIHTELGADKIVSMNLLNSDDESVHITFPDLSGESFRDMWESRDCSKELLEILRGGEGMLLFVNANKIKPPLLTVSVAALAKSIGHPLKPGQEQKWDASLAPTQVKVVDLMHHFCSNVIDVQPRKVAVILSAWDKVEKEKRTPEAYLKEHLPLLDQYLRAGADSWEWRVYGVSAQGGDYLVDNVPPTKTQQQKIDKLLAFDDPSKRIKIVFDKTTFSDLTEPIAWLMK